MKDEIKEIKQRENSRKYYQAHKEEILAKQYEYKKKKYAEDPEYRKKVYKNSRRWVSKNREKVYNIKRKWQAEHRDPTKDEIIKQLREENKKIKWKIVELKEVICDWELYNDIKVPEIIKKILWDKE